MKILYLSVHEILERDELLILHELGHDVFSFQGAFMDPKGHISLKRPGIPGMEYHEGWANESVTYAKTKIPKEFFDRFDLIIVMHDPNVLVENWERMKHKPVIWRTIGQSTPTVENMIRKMRYEDLKIVRMSTMEKNIIGYVGEDVVIHFYKDPQEWSDWNGNTKRVINFTQSLLGRRIYCHYDAINRIIQGFPSLIYGSGNTDLAGLDGGELSYDLMKGALRDNRVFVYGGTYPSPYTLSVQEAMMTGIPVVALGQHLAEDIPEIPVNDRINYYEMPYIIENGKNGYISDDINELRSYVHQLLEDQELAKRIGDQGRKTAMRIWNKENIKQAWDGFLRSL